MLPYEDRGRSMIRARSTTSIATDKGRPQNVVLNPQRAVSVHHSGQTPRIREGSTVLRQAALRNGLLRSSSGNNIHITNQVNHPGPTLNKNIPMVSHEPRDPRAPHLKNRWAQFSINQPKEPKESRSPPATQDLIAVVHKVPETNKGSVSPLTFVKNSTGDSLPTAATTMTATPTTPTTENKFGDLHGEETKLTDSRSTRASRPFHRMSALMSGGRSDHNSMHSLVPASRFVSTLDGSDEETEMDDSETENKDGDDSNHIPSIEHGEAQSVIDIMKEINDFQTTLVDRTPARKDNFALTRTQQKLLDLKDLVTTEQGPHAATFKSLLDYAVKIQHEAILSEWTQIRLRFSSHATTRKNISCGAGVLGFVQRYQNLPGSTDQLAVKEDEVSDYIQKLWADELLKISETPPRVTLPTYDEGVDIYKEHPMPMSSLTRSVMMSRESTQSH